MEACFRHCIYIYIYIFFFFFKKVIATFYLTIQIFFSFICTFTSRNSDVFFSELWDINRTVSLCQAILRKKVRIARSKRANEREKNLNCEIKSRYYFFFIIIIQCREWAFIPNVRQSYCEVLSENKTLNKLMLVLCSSSLLLKNKN